MDKLENRIPPPIVVLIFGALMWTAAGNAHLHGAGGAIRIGLAGLVFAAGLIIAGSGVWAFRQAATTIDPIHIDAASTLVTAGIFRYTRNPMYVGFTTILVAWAILLSTPWALLGPVLFALFLTRFQIAPEERAMLAKFGTSYSEYQQKVRRWL
jgi:protein-S-isoprenylcysteine O-methyltransferase Ste14